MRHEHRLTLSMIEEMAFHIFAASTYYPLYEPSFEEPYMSGITCAPAMSPSLSTCSTMSTGTEIYTIVLGGIDKFAYFKDVLRRVQVVYQLLKNQHLRLQH